MLITRLSLIVITLALFCPGAGVVFAANFHDGVAAYERGDIPKALQAWQPAAEQGDVLAEYNLGALYAHGRGVKKDPAEAAKWYRKAAAHDVPQAQEALDRLAK